MGDKVTGVTNQPTNQPTGEQPASAPRPSDAASAVGTGTAPAEGDRFVANAAPAAPAADEATALAQQAAAFGEARADAAAASVDISSLPAEGLSAHIAGLTHEATLRVAAQLFDIADRMHERIIRATRQARESGAADAATYRRLAAERQVDEERLRELRGPFERAALPPEHRVVMNGLLSSHGQVFAASDVLSTVADLHQVGQRERAERLLDAFLDGERAQQLLVDGNGYVVSASRRELASSLVIFLTQGGKQRWVDHRLVIDLPDGAAPYGATSPLFRFQPWPPSPDDMAMRTVLGILGWDLVVERPTSQGLIFHFDFGATRVEAAPAAGGGGVAPAPGGSFSGVVEEGGSISGAGGEGVASAEPLEDPDPAAVLGAETMVGADGVSAAIIGAPPPPTLVR